MKKRVLSLLLLFAMVVTALPLVALPVVAAEGDPTFTEEQYNALYVDGATLALDLYRNNEYWADAANRFSTNIVDYIWAGTASFTANTLASGANPYFAANALGASIYINGTEFAGGDYAVTQEMVARVTAGSSYAFNTNAMLAGATASGNDLTLSGFRFDVLSGETSPHLRIGSYNGASVSATAAGALGKVVGYSFAMDAPNVDDMVNTFDWTGVVNINNRANNEFFFVEWVNNGDGTVSKAATAVQRRIRTSLPTYTEGTYTDPDTGDVTTGKFITGFTASATTNVSADGGAFYTQGEMQVYANGTALLDEATASNIYFPRNRVYYGKTIVNLWGGTKNCDYYAIRYYKKTLTDTEVAQNRFADLAKWFRLDLSFARYLSSEELAALGTYANEKGYTFDSERETVAADLEAKANELFVAQFAEDSVLQAAVEAALARGLDPTVLTENPKEYLPNTIAFLLADYSGDYAEGYAAAQAADKALFTGFGTDAEAAYNALYVHDDGLFFAADFYRNNEYWLEEGAVPSTALQSYRWKTGAYFSRDNTTEAMAAGGYLDTANLPSNEVYITNSEKNAPVDGTWSVTQELVASSFKTNNPTMKVNGLWVATSVSGGFTMTKLTWGESGSSLTGGAQVPITAAADNKVHSFAFALQGTGIDGSGGTTTGTAKIYADGNMAYNNPSAVFPNELKYYTEAGATGRSSIRYWGLNSNLYAVRYYTRVLTEDELEQNRFADLAKWFRLDLSIINRLEDLTPLYELVDTKGYTFDSDRDTVAETIAKEAMRLFAEQEEGSLPDEILMTVLVNGIDADTVASYPKALIPTAYAVLLRGYGDVKGDFDAALAADLASGVLDEAGYNALYVQDQLYYAYDFFRTNEHWSYTDAIEGAALTLDEFKAAFAEFAYVGTTGFNKNTAYRGTPTITIKNGYLDTGNSSGAYPFEYLALDLQGTNKGVGGETGQHIRALGNTADNLSLQNLRFSVRSGKLQAIGALGDPTNAKVVGASPNMTVADETLRHTYTIAYKLPLTLDSTSDALGAFGDAAVAAGTGKLLFLQDGNEIYKNDEMPFRNTTNDGTDYILRWGSYGASKVYGSRYYNKILSDAEVAQNNFADLAKWFRLNLTGLEFVSDKSLVYTSEKLNGLTFDSAKATVQKAVTEAIGEAFLAEGEAYEALRGELPDAFVDLAVEYHFDLEGLLATGRKMDSVFERVTAAALTGMTVREAREFFDEAYFDAYSYLSYTAEGEDDWNAFLTDVAEKFGAADGVDLEALMALPKAKRYAAATLTTESADALQAAVDAYVAEAMAEYEKGEYPETTLSEYNQLYVHNDSFVYAVDYFYSNTYWNGTFTGENEDLATNLKNEKYRWRIGKDYFLKNYDADISIYSSRDSVDVMGPGYYDTEPYGNVNAWTGQETLMNTKAHLFGNGNTTYAVTEEYVASFDWISGTGRPMIAVNGLWIRTLAGEKGEDLVLSPLSWGEGGPTMTMDGVSPAGTVSGGNGAARNYAFVLHADGIDNSQENDAYRTVMGDFAMYANAANIFTTTEDDKVTYTTNQSAYGQSVLQYWGSPCLFYAYRHYRTALTELELQQNHFADLAKWYRLDVSGYLNASDAQKAELYEAMSAYSVGGEGASIRTEIQTLVDIYTEEVFDYESLTTEQLSAGFIALAKKHELPVKTLLSIKEKAGRDAITKVLTDNFDANYATNAVVLSSMLEEAMAFLGSVEFRGVSIRTGSYAGIRGCFAFDEELVLSLVDKGVEVGASITLNGVTKTFAFQVVDGVITGIDGAQTWEYEDGLGYVYTMTYKNMEKYDEETRAQLYNTEYTYEFYVKIDGQTYTRTTDFGRFGDAVSAVEVYQFFASAEEYQELVAANAELFAEVLSYVPQA